MQAAYRDRPLAASGPDRVRAGLSRAALSPVHPQLTDPEVAAVAETGGRLVTIADRARAEPRARFTTQPRCAFAESCSIAFFAWSVYDALRKLNEQPENSRSEQLMPGETASGRAEAQLSLAALTWPSVRGFLSERGSRRSNVRFRDSFSVISSRRRISERHWTEGGHHAWVERSRMASGRSTCGRSVSDLH